MPCHGSSSTCHDAPLLAGDRRADCTLVCFCHRRSCTSWRFSFFPANNNCVLLAFSRMNDTCHIALCPNCSRSISRSISRAPSQTDLDTLRSGDLPPETIPSQHYISKAEDAEREILAFDTEIRRLQALTRELQAHRQSLADYAEQQRSLVAPVRRVPTEVMENIFLLACRTPEFAFPLQPTMTKRMSVMVTTTAAADWQGSAGLGKGLGEGVYRDWVGN